MATFWAPLWIVFLVLRANSRIGFLVNSLLALILRHEGLQTIRIVVIFVFSACMFKLHRTLTLYQKVNRSRHRRKDWRREARRFHQIETQKKENIRKQRQQTIPCLADQHPQIHALDGIDPFWQVHWTFPHHHKFPSPPCWVDTTYSHCFLGKAVCRRDYSLEGSKTKKNPKKEESGWKPSKRSIP